MLRSVRSRKPHTKYSEEEYILGTKSTKVQAKKLDKLDEKTETDNLANKSDAKNEVDKGIKTRAAKGNLNTGWKTVKAIQTNVLRDRTNIPAELLKVDLLMKQGTGQGIAKKPAIIGRGRLKSPITGDNDDENVKMTSSAIPTRKKALKVVAGEESASDGNSKDIEENVKSVNFEDDEAPESSAKPTRRTAKSVTSAKNDDKNVRATISAKITRKTSRKVETEKESISGEKAQDTANNVQPITSENDEAPEKPARSTRGTTRSATSGKNDDKNVKTASSAKITRKTSRKVETEKETISSEEAQDIAENVESINSENDKAPEKPARSTRGTTGSAILGKNDDKNVKATSSAKITRKTSRKVETEKETISSEEAQDIAENFEPINSENNEVPEKPAKSTRGTTRSATSGKNDDKDVKKITNSPVITRKTSRKVEIARCSSSVPDDGTKDIVENDKSVVSEDVAITKKLVKRATSKKTLLPKKSEKIVISTKKSIQRVSRAKVNVEDAKAIGSAAVAKKFFKSKATDDDATRIITPAKTTVIAKRRNIGTRQRPRASMSFRMRQTTLGESFAKQISRKVLRPRKAETNYCEQSIVVKKRVSKNTDEVNVAEKKTGPVYKRVNSRDNSTNEKNEIYEFQFDSDDSREKFPKKTRKKKVRKNIATIKGKPTGSGPKKVANSRKREIAKTANNNGKIEKVNVAVEVTSEQTKQSTTSPRDVNINVMPCEPMEIDEIPSTAKISSVLPVIEKKTTKNIAVQVSKPIIVKTLELKGNERIKLTTTPIIDKTLKTKTKYLSQPSKQYQTMLNHVLLTKSISPITKAIESFDPGSPWRPPVYTYQEFSRVKNVVQSTPQVEKCCSKVKNTGTVARTEIAASTDTRIKKIKVKNIDDAKLSKILDKKSPVKAIGLAKSPRKFGTVISNNNNAPSIGTRIVEANKEDSSDKKISPVVSSGIETIVAIKSVNTITDDHVEETNFSNDNFVDKENFLPPCPSPKKSPLRPINKSPLKNPNKSPLKRPNESPLKNFNKSPLKSPNKSPLKRLNDTPLKSLKKSSLASPKKLIFAANSQRPLNKASNNENSEPQAVASCSKNPDPIDDSRILRQSNLDNFLNLDEMPKSTRIKTSHGIFDDVHSTPISGKPIERIGENSNVKNAFGFDDSDDSDLDISPIKVTNRQLSKPGLTRNRQNEREKKDVAIPARLSIGDVKKHLLPIRKKGKAREEPIIERIEEEEEKEKRDSKEKERVTKDKKNPDPITLTDVFDQLAENLETNDASMKEIPLFADIEPAHFKQAPRYSYKRKRAVGFFSSDGEDENDSSVVAEDHGAKKRKKSKVEKEREKQMENWAKDINRTFEEIDHFDLVVE